MSIQKIIFGVIFLVIIIAALIYVQAGASVAKTGFNLILWAAFIIGVIAAVTWIVRKWRART